MYIFNFEGYGSSQCRKEGCVNLDQLEINEKLSNLVMSLVRIHLSDFSSTNAQ